MLLKDQGGGGGLGRAEPQTRCRWDSLPVPCQPHASLSLLGLPAGKGLRPVRRCQHLGSQLPAFLPMNSQFFFEELSSALHFASDRGISAFGGAVTSLGVEITKYWHKFVWKAGKFLVDP